MPRTVWPRRPSRRHDGVEQIHPEDRPLVERAVAEATDLTGDGRYDVEYRVMPGGEAAWVRAAGRAVFGAGDNGDLVPERDGDGHVTTVSSVTRDVTERHANEQALQRSERDVRAITDDTPDILARFDRALRHLSVNEAVVNATGLQPDKINGRTNDEVNRPPAAMIRRNVESEGRLMEDLLDLTRVSQGKLELNLGTVDVHEMITRVVEMVAAGGVGRPCRTHAAGKAAGAAHQEPPQHGKDDGSPAAVAGHDGQDGLHRCRRPPHRHGRAD